MPKIKVQDWKNYGIDPQSEEYDPSFKELEEEAQAIDILNHEIYAVEEQIGNMEN